MLDWSAAKETLYRISKKHLRQFLAGQVVKEFYGFGFFCDAYQGSVYLVANSLEYHHRTFKDFITQYGTTDEQTFKWDIGNWEFPGGLFRSSSPEQMEFDSAWNPIRQSLEQMDGDGKQDVLEDVCIGVLERLIQEDTFSPAVDVQGFIVLGPDDRSEVVMAYGQNSQPNCNC